MFFDVVSLLSPEKVVYFVLVMTRLSGMMITAPLISTYPIPNQVKAALVALIAFITYPLIAKVSPIEHMPVDLLGLGIMSFKEVVVGAIIGFCMNLIFVSIQIAGQLISIQMALAISDILDPVTKTQTPVIGQFYLFMAMIVFLFINGDHYLFTSVLSSYHLIPIDTNFILQGALVEKIIYFTSQIFVIAFSVVMPVYSVLLIMTVLLGFTSKMMPQMNIFTLAMPFKIYVGIALMALFISKTYSFMAITIESLLISVNKIFL
jgi:flagellar biosynthetic protein FliR